MTDNLETIAKQGLEKIKEAESKLWYYVRHSGDPAIVTEEAQLAVINEGEQGIACVGYLIHYQVFYDENLYDSIKTEDLTSIYTGLKEVRDLLLRRTDPRQFKQAAEFQRIGEFAKKLLDELARPLFDHAITTKNTELATYMVMVRKDLIAEYKSKMEGVSEEFYKTAMKKAYPHAEFS